MPDTLLCAATDGTGPPADDAVRARLAPVPEPPDMNPYTVLLYEHLGREGFELVGGGELRVRWLWRNRGEVDILHFNWPQGLYRYQRRPVWLRRQLSWAKLILFAVRLGVARALGYRLVWTIHQVYPHDTAQRSLDRAAGIVLAWACQVLLAHDEPTAEVVRADLGRRGARTSIVPHGSYVGVYPLLRSRAEVRAELGIAGDVFTFLCFGELRRHKDVAPLMQGFTAASLANAALIVAGYPKEAAVADQVARAAAADGRIKPLLSFVPKEDVAALFAASDAAVVARSDGGTSGALVLALSMGVPVVAADRPAYRSLIGDERAGWLFDSASPSGLTTALERAAADADGARAKGGEALAIAAGLSWSEIAARTARLLEAPLR